MPISREDAIVGCLLGTALGDATGLWCEGMSPRRQRRFCAAPDGPRLLFGRGMISDDTEHACMVAQALIVSAGEQTRFLRSLAWRFRWWLLGLPAGIGRATLRACIKLWLGFSGKRSGVFSAGNAPAMRSPLLGVCFGHDRCRLRALVRACTRITHTDPKAEFGAYVVALAAHLASTRAGAPDLPDVFSRELRQDWEEDIAWQELIQRAIESAASGEETEEFARGLGLATGVSGYALHTVPVVIQAWLRHRPDFRKAVRALVKCGGDTDTTAAIVGAILGAEVGKNGLPGEWLARVWEWPRSMRWIEKLGIRLAGVCAAGKAQKTLPLFLPGIFLRNLFFLILVLLHGFRRLLPPY